MAMTKEEEKELRMNCSIGMLLGNLSTRTDLKKELPIEEAADKNEGGKKRSAEEEEEKERSIKKSREEDERRVIQFFSEDTPDYNEDDPDWVIEEKKFLIEEYGKKTITLNFDEGDRFIYSCEVCSVEAYTKPMLEAHCLGMKHLKKKKLLDMKLQGKEIPTLLAAPKSTNVRATKPLSATKPEARDPDDPRKGDSWKNKKRWQNKNYYNNYGPGGNPGFYNQPPPFGPPPGFPGGAPPGAPPNYYGPWGSGMPNIFNTPPPAVDSNKKDSLAGGNTGSLLQKLADCAVKNEKDSELAINVVIALMKSLKDFNHKRGETKFIEVLTEADVTFRVLKTLKPVNKDGNNTSFPAANLELQQDNGSSSARGVSEFVQETPVSQAGNYPAGSQYYNSNDNNPSASNGNYGYGNSPVPTGVPPPGNFNARSDTPYNQNESNQNYGQTYGNQGTPNNTQSNTGYPPDNYSNQGYENQGPGFYNQGQSDSQSSSSYPYSGQQAYPQASSGTPNSQATDQFSSNQGGQKPAGSSSQPSSGAVVPPPPPPPPPPTTATSSSSSSTDSTAPDFSNYGYAAGYSMGYYNAPPPAFNQPY